MSSSSEVGVSIIEAAARDDLGTLKEIKERIGDVEFRKWCDFAPGFQGLRVLHYAAGMGTIHICRFLVEEVGIDIDVETYRRDTPLLHAIRMGQVITAKYLIKRGAEIAISDSNGFTPLHLAVQKENKELMKLLLIKGADIEAYSVGGTPLHYAVSCRRAGAVKFLLDHGAEPNSVCKLSNCSPLICAIFSHSVECMRLLVKAGADPNKDANGVTPLALAAADGETKCIRLLVVAGADLNAVSANGMKPVEHAAMMLKHEAVRILFPVTNRISNYPSWSISGMMKFIHSDRAKERANIMMNVLVCFLKNKGDGAWRTKDYSSAVKWYSEAIFHNRSNEKLLSNRSLCWEQMGEAAFALHDAKECVRLKPDWAKAHFRVGSAWQLLQCHRMSSDAFKRASALAPRNEEIGNAYKESLRLLGTLTLD